MSTLSNSVTARQLHDNAVVAILEMVDRNKGRNLTNDECSELVRELAEKKVLMRMRRNSDVPVRFDSTNLMRLAKRVVEKVDRNFGSGTLVDLFRKGSSVVKKKYLESLNYVAEHIGASEVEDADGAGELANELVSEIPTVAPSAVTPVDGGDGIVVKRTRSLPHLSVCSRGFLNQDCKKDNASNLTPTYIAGEPGLLPAPSPAKAATSKSTTMVEPSQSTAVEIEATRSATRKPSHSLRSTAGGRTGTVADSFESTSACFNTVIQHPNPDALRPGELYDPAMTITYHVPNSQPPTPANKDALEGLQALNAYTASTAKKRKHSDTLCDETSDVNHLPLSSSSDKNVEKRRREQHIADTVHFLKPSQVQSEWDWVFSLMRNAVGDIFDGNCISLKETVKFASMKSRKDPLWQLYQEILGDDKWQIVSLQGSLKANHVLLALIGRVVQHVMDHEREEAWYEEWRLESVSSLNAAMRETLSAQGLNPYEIIKQRDHTWVTGSAFAIEQEIDQRALGLAFQWTQTLTPHLKLLIGDVQQDVLITHLRTFDDNIKTVLQAAMRLQIRLLVTGPYSFLWPQAGRPLDPLVMKEIIDASAHKNVVVAVPLTPAIMRNKSEVICKARVYCRVGAPEASAFEQLQQASTDDGLVCSRRNECRNVIV